MAKNKFLTTNYGYNNEEFNENIMFGYDNKTEENTKSNFIIGHLNKLFPNTLENYVFGSNCQVYGSTNYVFGIGHKLNSNNAKNNIVFGTQNTTSYGNNVIIGQDNIIHGHSNFIIGTGHVIQQDNVVIFGNYATDGNYLFAIGNGTISKKQNALELDLDSNLKIQGDLITKDGKLSELLIPKQNLEYLEKYGSTDVYVLQKDVDIVVEDNVVTQLLKSDYSAYEAVAFPEGIIEINLGIQENSYWHGQPFIANKVIMPLTLERIEMDSFTNDIIFNDDERFDENSPTIKTQGDYVWDDASVIIRVKEFVLNERLEEPILEFYNNIYLEKINIPLNWDTILGQTLYNCINLKGLVIPATVKYISYSGMGSALNGYSDIIYGYGGTAAETYAKENNIPFVNIGSNYSEKIKDIELLEKYGTTDVYVLQEGVDFITDSTGTVITGTADGNLLDKSGYTVAIPKGITTITSEEYTCYLKADKLILPQSCTLVENESVNIETQLILSEGMQTFTSLSIGFKGDLYLPSSINSLNLESFMGNIYTSEKATEFVLSSNNISGNIYCSNNINNVTISAAAEYSNVYIYNPNALIKGNFGNSTTVYGYAGSTAEKYANDYGCAFINIGSDCAPFLNKSISTEETIRANEYYTFTGDEDVPLSSLTVTLDTVSTEKLDEFMFSFETPADISGFSFGVLTDESVEIKWIKEPNLKPNYIYEVSVVNGVGVIAGTAKEVTE